MAVLSVDLACRKYADVGVVVLEQGHDFTDCELLRYSSTSSPSPDTLADYLDTVCLRKGIHLLLLDGPQGWKAKDNGLEHSRRCERELNTPAKTGEPWSVKPATYSASVRFSIAVYDALGTRGWQRLPRVGLALEPPHRMLIESFPMSAWKSLGIAPLSAKARTRPADLASRLAVLQQLFQLRLSGAPTHDELQAMVSGLAGLALERNEWEACAVAGLAPVVEEGYWREGFIVNVVHPNV